MCECLKGFVMPPYLTELANPEWGPVYWKLFHILATRIGYADEMTDTDAANAFFYLINSLHQIVPCADCQNHTRTYLSEQKFDPRGLVGAPLRNYVETWLLNFHNAVRTRMGKPILVSTVEEYHALWRPQKFLPCDEEKYKLFVAYGKTYLVVQVMNFKRWNMQLTKLRIMFGV